MNFGVQFDGSKYIYFNKTTLAREFAQAEVCMICAVRPSNAETGPGTVLSGASSRVASGQRGSDFFYHGASNIQTTLFKDYP